MNAFARLEYVSLRLIRKYLLPEGFANRIAGWLPYYRSSVNETNPGQIVSAYADALALAGLSSKGCTVVEVGAGRTNVVAYGLAADGAGEVWALEPFVAHDIRRDALLLQEGHPGRERELRGKVHRVTSFDQLGDGSADLVLSNSVLEHVTDLDGFFAGCRRVLRPGGAMLHLVDYRDHFFKYPYAFLTFSGKQWARWLDPGDLPRWRLYDHVAAIARAGFSVDVLEKEVLADEFARVRDALASPFDSAGPDVAVTYAALCGRPLR